MKMNNVLRVDSAGNSDQKMYTGGSKNFNENTGLYRNKKIVKPTKPKMGLIKPDKKKMNFTIGKDLMRQKPGIPNGPTVGNVYKTY